MDEKEKGMRRRGRRDGKKIGTDGKVPWDEKP